MNTHHILSRRNFLIAGGGAAGAVLLASCSGGTAEGNPDEITGAGWADGLNDLVFGQIKDDFEAATGLTVTPQASVPFDDYQTRFRTLIAGGSPPDLMRLNDDFLREMSDKETIMDIGSYLSESDVDTSDYFEGVLDFTDLPNGRAGLAIGALPRVIYFNKTLFEEKGVPLPPTTWTSEGWTWEDFLETARALTDDETWGACVVTDTAYENTFAVNNGGEGIFSEDGRSFALAGPEGLEALQWVADLALVHEVAPTWAEVSGDDAEQQLFVGGRLAMLFSSMSISGYLSENVTEFEWDIAPVPGNVNQYSESSMALMVIPTAAANPDGAWEFLKYITGPDGGQAIAEHRVGVPLSRTAAEALEAGDTGPANIHLFIEAANNNRSVHSTTATAAAVAIYRPELERALIGEITVEEALTGARDQVEATLA
ncbi:ABC transporter substrate-binding protein [Ruania zhangjianzhongii]|uniref:ABC transporter substrate-binding protein n=1 Tax=Ruania zhangjianzhongii TaxID=2603206 RepID=UPI0011C8C156|nr:sugar ABC transporter substrate-binding protein [Ruania zhangjianzhongii]